MANRRQPVPSGLAPRIGRGDINALMTSDRVPRSDALIGSRGPSLHSSPGYREKEHSTCSFVVLLRIGNTEPPRNVYR